ncbi:MAG: hypothetical protein M1824_003251 [Vezdaea acicularis]|nr:MAG: hypothetical protein M1824_003251 [Vezdaea acicularis]
MPDSSESAAVLPSPAQPPVYTYHHLCSQLLLASTHQLEHLRRRAPPAVDKAIILPLPPPPRSPDESDEEEEEELESEAEADASRRREKKLNARANEQRQGYSVLLSVTYDKKPMIIRRDDGFEKRHIFRCGRCRGIVGYGIDSAATGHGQEQDLKIAYLLPGGLMTTEEMRAGKVFTEEELSMKST